MPVTADKPAPYAPGATILEVIERRRSRGLQAPLTADVLGRAGIAQTLIPRVTQSLIGLDLIEADGTPTKTFETIRLAPETEYRKQLEQWLKGTYADVFAFVDPTKDDETRVRDAFRSYEPLGQQPRMVSLFLALCGAAGLTPEKSTTPRSTPRPRSAPPSSRVVRRVVPVPGSGRQVVTKKLGLLHPAISGLLDGLPAEWTAAEKAKFMKTFETVLDYAIPVVKEKKETAA